MLTVQGLVTHSEEKNLDGVREADVVLLWSVDILWVETTWRCGLYLFDKNITRSTCHALTLIVRNDSVVGPYTDRAKLRSCATAELPLLETIGGAVCGYTMLLVGDAAGTSGTLSSWARREVTTCRDECPVWVRQ